MKNRLALRINAWEKIMEDVRGTRFEHGYTKPGSMNKPHPHGKKR